MRSVEEIRRAGPVLARHVRGHGYNQAIAVWITQKVGSMPCAYLFAGLTLISLPAAILSGNVIVIVAWIAQTFFQLVLLPVILVGQSVQQAHSDARSEQDHALLSGAHDKLDQLLTNRAPIIR